ncbi:hypothetical protein ScPMuIL_013664 [Solemya velum]
MACNDNNLINVDLWGQEAIDEEMFQSIIQDLGLSTPQSNPATDNTNPTSSDSGAAHGRHRLQSNPVTDNTNPTSSDSGAAHGRHRLQSNPATDNTNPTSSDSGAAHGRHRLQSNPATDNTNPTSSDSGAAHGRHPLQSNPATDNINPTSSDSGAAHGRHRLKSNSFTSHSKRSRHHFKKMQMLDKRMTGPLRVRRKCEAVGEKIRTVIEKLYSLAVALNDLIKLL